MTVSFLGALLAILNITRNDTENEQSKLWVPKSLEIYFLSMWPCYQFDIELGYLFPSVLKLGTC